MAVIVAVIVVGYSGGDDIGAVIVAVVIPWDVPGRRLLIDRLVQYVRAQPLICKLIEANTFRYFALH